MAIEVVADVVEKVDLASLEIMKGYYTTDENNEELIVKLGICFPDRKVYFNYRN